MNWLTRKFDELRDRWVLRNVDEVEVYGGEGGYFIEYGGRLKDYESFDELMQFYNQRMDDRIDSADLSVIGNADQDTSEHLHRSGESDIVKGQKYWAVDVFNTAKNYADDAAFKTGMEKTTSTVIGMAETDDGEYETVYHSFDDEDDRSSKEIFDQHIIDALSATVTQAVIHTETEEREKVELEYIIDKLE